MLAIFFVGSLVVTGSRLPGFLQLNRPVRADVFVITTGVRDSVLQELANDAKADPDRVFLVVGGRIDRGSFLSGYKTFAELSARTLGAFGVPPQQIVTLVPDESQRDRTYQSAQAVRAWLHDRGESVSAINVVAKGAHSRRTSIIYRRTIEATVAVGVIAIPNIEFENSDWWKTSAGVRSIIGELIAYVYVQLFFRPY